MGCLISVRSKEKSPRRIPDGPSGHSRYPKAEFYSLYDLSPMWQPHEQVQVLVEMGFTEATVRSALEAADGDLILAIIMLCFAECGPAGIDTYRKDGALIIRKP